ncbi:hypothetical protein BDN70DRAFT_984315 [Pholiota conissans]|uniref:Uncharacterized protein n=1 Tax=Pholiota conissans TaxID=109636 RepID=A0A9P6CLA3_9AGAR|nr:hypothetical protein BDN70DRAFT_984315 [Pholiota conissans]
MGGCKLNTLDDVRYLLPLLALLADFDSVLLSKNREGSARGTCLLPIPRPRHCRCRTYSPPSNPSKAPHLLRLPTTPVYQARPPCPILKRCPFSSFPPPLSSIVASSVRRSAGANEERWAAGVVDERRAAAKREGEMKDATNAVASNLSPHCSCHLVVRHPVRLVVPLVSANIMYEIWVVVHKKACIQLGYYPALLAGFELYWPQW